VDGSYGHVRPRRGLLPPGALTGAQARGAAHLAAAHALQKHLFYEAFPSTLESTMARARGEPRREGEAAAWRALQAARDAEVAAAAAALAAGCVLSRACVQCFRAPVLPDYLRARLCAVSCFRRHESDTPAASAFVKREQRCVFLPRT
jgi:hypothetical protein